jgi:hypothetical protein
MHAEDLLVHYSGYRKTVEAVGEGLPKLNIVPPLAYSMRGEEGEGDVMNYVALNVMINLTASLCCKGYRIIDARISRAIRLGLLTRCISHRM